MTSVLIVRFVMSLGTTHHGNKASRKDGTGGGGLVSAYIYSTTVMLGSIWKALNQLGRPLQEKNKLIELYIRQNGGKSQGSLIVCS